MNRHTPTRVVVTRHAYEDTKNHEEASQEVIEEYPTRPMKSCTIQQRESKLSIYQTETSCFFQENQNFWFPNSKHKNSCTVVLFLSSHFKASYYPALHWCLVHIYLARSPLVMSDSSQTMLNKPFLN